MVVSPSQAKELVIDVISAGLVPMLHSSPGIGKSSIVNAIAKEFNLLVIDIRLSQIDPTELNGYLYLGGNAAKASYKPTELFPLEGEPLPKGYDGWLLFFDELTSAVPSVQSASYKVILDRLIGNKKLHKNVAIVAAGNLITDGAVVSRTSTALQSRMVHLHLEANLQDFVRWGLENSLDHRVISFVQYRPDLLHNFNPKHNDKTFACPRTWEFLSRIIKRYPDSIGDNKLPVLQGTVGEGAGIEFLTFSQIYQDLITLDEILANPATCKVPREPALLWALTGVIASNLNQDNAASLVVYIERLNTEFAILTLRQAGLRNPKLLDIPAIDTYLTRVSAILMG